MSDELDAIRARLAAITPGPRRVRLEAWETQAYVDLPNGDVITFDTDCAPDDAAFDAAAPADIAALLAELDRVRALIDGIYPISHDETCQLRVDWRKPFAERECTCDAGAANIALEAALRGA